MTNIRLINNLIAGFCLLFGGTLNGILIYLILRKTPPTLRVYSKILLQTCVLDLLFLVLTVVAVPVGTFKTLIFKLFLMVFKYNIIVVATL